MPPKGKKIMIRPSTRQIRSQLPQIRRKILIGQNSEIHKAAVAYANSLPYIYGTRDDDVRPDHIGKINKEKYQLSDVPAELNPLVSFFIHSQRIPLNELKSVVISILPPPLLISDYENIIENAGLISRDRCLYFANSDVFMKYKMIDPEKLKSLAGLTMPSNGMEFIEERMERGYGYHLDADNAITLSLRFTNQKTFTESNCDGSRTVSFDTKPLTRFVFIIDFIATSVAVKSRLNNAMQKIGDIAENDEGEKGQIASRILENVNSQRAELTAKNTPDEDDVPLLIEVADFKEGTETAEDIANEEDIEDVDILESTRDLI